MSDDEDTFSTTLTLTRGSGTDDRDKIRVKVSAPDVTSLDRRVSEVRESMESWADDLRDVQPEQSRKTSEDQTELGAVEA